ncbi:MAG TPA: TonB-dependent receptor [Novosphingobium sp.]|nr:TonB-dependent receptor [Novosphingobium sp.]
MAGGCASAALLVAPAVYAQQAAASPASAQPGDASAPDTKDARPQDKVIIVNAAKQGHGAPLALSNNPATDPASITVVTQDDIANKVTTSTADLLRGSNGVQVSDYGQVGEAQGVTMRGWSNGYDSSFLSYYQDGMQRNEPSHISSNGYLDLNPLIPETVKQFTIIRGPFDVRYGGNFALAGSIVATTLDTLPNSISVSGGSYGMARALLTLGHSWGDTHLSTAIDGQRSDGYRDSSGAKLLKTFTKFVTPLGGGRFSLGLETYDNQFDQPGYIDEGSIRDGTISAKSASGVNDHGTAHTYSLIGNYLLGDFEKGIEITVGGRRNLLNRTATTIPFPQYYRRDARWEESGSIEGHYHFTLAGVDVLALGGVSIQNSDINLLELPANDGSPIEGINALDAYFYARESITETTKSVYGSLQIKPAEWIKLTAGARYDHFSFDVANQTYDSTNNVYVNAAFKSGTGRFSPKVGLALSPVPWVSFYVNYGQSPHSPSAFGELTSNPGLSVSHLSSVEGGVSFDPWHKRLHFQANFYKTVNTNEVGQVGYTYVNFGTSRRKGYDLEAAVDLLKAGQWGLRLTGNYSHVSARLADGGYVPYVAQWLAAYGIRVQGPVGSKGDTLRLDLDHEFFGPQKLDEAGTFVASPYNRLSAKIRYAIPRLHDLNVWTGAVYYPGSVYNEFAFDLYGRVYTNPEPRVQFQLGAGIKF